MSNAPEIAASHRRQREHYGYVSKPGATYSLRRDGKEVFRGDESACWRWVHANCCFSVHEAVKRQGFCFVEVGADGKEVQ